MVHVKNLPKTSLDVMIQDQTSEIIDLYMLNLDDAIELTLSQGQSINDKSITVTDATGVLDTGVHAIDISENGRKFQAIVTDVTGLVVSFNAPLDFDITTNAKVEIAGWNMAIDGSATTNGGLAERMYDVVYPTKVPAGVYSLRARRTFAGQEKNGVVIRLNGDAGDKLEFIISDDLADVTFTKFVCVAQGHVVE